MRQPIGQATLGTPAFEAIADLAYRESGLKLVPEKIMMVQSRLRHRLRALDVPDFDAYRDLVCSQSGSTERRFMISALTTNVSHFFREPHHFDLLLHALVPRLKQRIANGDRIRIWSAGCSNGQEPYSIAMHVLRAVPDLAHADFRILATDIDPKVVTFAKRGIYSNAQLAGLSAAHQAQFLQPASNDAHERQIGASIVDCVSFKELNLLSDWPMRFPFDAIFCRNVVIYFDATTQERLWPRFHNCLADDGQLFLGHSERIVDPAAFGFKTIGPTAYVKSNGTRAASSAQNGG